MELRPVVLSDFLALLHGRHLIAGAATAVLITAAAYIFGPSLREPKIISLLLYGMFVLVLLLALAFLIFSGYSHVLMFKYSFGELMTSVSVVSFVALTSAYAARSFQNVQSFEITQLILSLILSVIAGLMFAVLSRIAQKVYGLIS